MSTALRDVAETNAYLVKLKASCKGEQFGKIAQQQAAALAKRLGKSSLQCDEGIALIEKVLEGPWEGGQRDLLGCSGVCYHVNIIMLIRSRISLS